MQIDMMIKDLRINHLLMNQIFFQHRKRTKNDFYNTVITPHVTPSLLLLKFCWAGSK